jgi:hypothetical protein
MKTIFIFVGAILGVSVVRLFLLNGVEQFAWNIFWDLLPKGESFDIKAILESTTFWKCTIGALAGAVAGHYFGK